MPASPVMSVQVFDMAVVKLLVSHLGGHDGVATEIVRPSVAFCLEFFVFNIDRINSNIQVSSLIHRLMQPLTSEIL